MGDSMPSLARFLSVLVVLGLIAAAGMVALATLVEPRPREMTIPLPKDRFTK